MEVRRWIETDESAAELLARTLARRPFLLLPPLHRVPLRAGNVVEIVGPSCSAKSEILLQVAVNCVLPKDWNGVHFGGMERLLFYFDLDCRFDVLRFSRALRCRIAEALNKGFTPGYSQVGSLNLQQSMSPSSNYSEELFLVCMRRFLYVRCYSSFEFLSALKTMRYRIQKEIEAQGVPVLFLMIDSINAFYWMDRASQPMLSPCNNRVNFSLQSIIESVVLEISRLLETEPMLVLATKAAILGTELYRDEQKTRSLGRSTLEEEANLTVGKEIKYREFMPSAWQGFVTHRVFLRVSEKNLGEANGPIHVYSSLWVQPPVNSSDWFSVTDDCKAMRDPKEIGEILLSAVFTLFFSPEC